MDKDEWVFLCIKKAATQEYFYSCMVAVSLFRLKKVGLKSLIPANP